MEPNWNKGPPDATHWGPDSKTYSECWYKKVDGTWYFCKSRRGEWHPMQNPPSKFRFGRMKVKP